MLLMPAANHLVAHMYCPTDLVCDAKMLSHSKNQQMWTFKMYINDAIAIPHQKQADDEVGVATDLHGVLVQRSHP